MQRLTVLALFVLLVPCARADGKKPAKAHAPPSARVAAQEILGAQGDDDARQRLARRYRPDPWRVASVLVSQGKRQVAQDFARRVPGAPGEGLPEYVQRRVDGGTDGVEAHLTPYAEGMRLVGAGKYDEGEALLEAALAEAKAIGWQRRVTWTTRKLGDVWYRRGQTEKAIGFYERSMAMAQATRDEQNYALAVHNRGHMHDLAGRLEEALRDYQAALAIERRVGTPGGLSYELSSVANVHMRRHDYATAARLMDEALAIEGLEQDKKRHAFALTHVGTARYSTGDYAVAERRFAQALALYRQLGDEDMEAWCLENLARAQGVMGRLTQRLETTRAALAIRRRQANARAVADLHETLGSIQESLGRRGAARRAHETAYATLKTELARVEAAGDVKATVFTAHALSEVARRLERGGDAIEHAATAVAAARTLGNERELQSSLVQFGRLCHEHDRPLEALAPLAEACRLADRLNEPVAAARAKYHEGWAYYELKRDDDAKAAYTNFLERTEQLPLTDLRARGYTALGRIALRGQDYEEAMVHAAQGIELVEELSRGQPESLASSTRDDFIDLYYIGIRSAGQVEDPERMAWFMERGRAGSLRDAFFHREALQAAKLPVELRNKLKTARAREREKLALYRAGLRGGKLRVLRAAKAAYELARTERRDLLVRIQREVKSAADLDLAPPDAIETMQAQLEPTDVMALYWLNWDGSVNVLVLRPKTARALTITSSIPLDDRIDSLYDGGERHVNPGALKGLRAHLADALGLDTSVKRVLVSPMGRMAYVPFHLLFPERTVVMVPSGTTYGMLRTQRALRGTQVLAIGDPDYDSVVHRTALAVHRGPSLAKLPRLPATRGEVERIADVAVLGPQATEKGVASALAKQKRWRAVHFACHGLVDPERPSFSSLALTADDENDGFLTCLDVCRMQIPADLVVLSACETGLGKIFKTEGIAGLTRAFMFAGTPRVICSLWKVDDEATRALMVKFYALWNPKKGRGLDAAEALKQAQAHVRSQPRWQHPYYWAAWVLWGVP